MADQYNFHDIARAPSIIETEADGKKKAGASATSPSKESPSSLAEQLTESQIPTGATFMVIPRNTTDGGLGQPIKFITNNFYLSAMQMAYKEKTQIMETFNSPAVAFFGDTIKVYSFSGKMLDYPSYTIQESNTVRDVLKSLKNQNSAAAASQSGPAIAAVSLNTLASETKVANQEQRAAYAHTMAASAFNIFYNESCRASKLFQNKQIALIRVFNHWIWGYPINFQLAYNANEDKVASFGMSFIVAKHEFGLEPLFGEDDLRNLFSTEHFYGRAKGKDDAAADAIKSFMEQAISDYFYKVEKEWEFNPDTSNNGSIVTAKKEKSSEDHNKTITIAPLLNIHPIEQNAISKTIRSLVGESGEAVLINVARLKKLDALASKLSVVSDNSTYFRLPEGIKNFQEIVDKLKISINTIITQKPNRTTESQGDSGEVLLYFIPIAKEGQTANLIKEITGIAKTFEAALRQATVTSL